MCELLQKTKEEAKGQRLGHSTFKKVDCACQCFYSQIFGAKEPSGCGNAPKKQIKRFHCNLRGLTEVWAKSLIRNESYMEDG